MLFEKLDIHDIEH
jgi:hypothetical protein